jgi:hypothetical protein
LNEDAGGVYSFTLMVLTLAPLQILKTFLFILDLGSSSEYKSSGERFNAEEDDQDLPMLTIAAHLSDSVVAAMHGSYRKWIPVLVVEPGANKKHDDGARGPGGFFR